MYNKKDMSDFHNINSSSPFYKVASSAMKKRSYKRGDLKLS